MIGKGVFEFEVEGKTVGFEFCMMASMFAEEESGLPIGEVNNGIAEGKLKSILQFFYGAAKAYQYYRANMDITIGDVAKWIDVLGLEKMTEIYLKAIAQPKNGLAPNPAAEVKGQAQ